VRASESPMRIFERFNEFRVLCARRTGRFGVSGVNATIEELLDEQRLVNTRETWYSGRPVMITRNDYNLRLFNGDVGIALPDAEADGRLKVFFFNGTEGLRRIVPGRLPEHETVYAMTVHKSQGSEFGDVVLILPDELSPIMTRELIYTAVTRAMRRVELWGIEDVFIAAVKQRLVRASALQERLWGSA
jgi:exodeoxyribonuclease V alpha subunit